MALSPLVRVQRLLTLDVTDLPSPVRAAVWAVRLVFFLVREMVAKRVSARAAALSYTSIGAAVPTATIGFALYSAIDPQGYARFARRVVFTLVTPVAPDSTEAAFAIFQTFTENARSLGTIGGALLIATCILAFLTIEATFNDVWEVRERRSLVSKTLSFWAALTLGPVLLGVAGWVSAQVEAGRFWAYAGPATTVLLIAMAFTAINIVLPYANVRAGPALWGGLATTALLLTAYEGYSWYLANAFGAKRLYGPMMLLPISLLGLYVAWFIVVVGAQVTYTMQNLKLLHLKSLGGLKARGRAYSTLRVMVRVAEGFGAGKAVTTLDLARELRVPEPGVRELVGRLVDKRLLAWAADGRNLFPARAPEKVSVADVLEEELDGAFDCSDAGESDRLAPVLRRVQRAGGDALGGLTVADLARGVERPPVRAPAAVARFAASPTGRARRGARGARRRPVRRARTIVRRKKRKRDRTAWRRAAPARTRAR